MQLKVVRVKRGAKVYEYAKLVRSYRNEQGSSVHEVVANLGQLPAQTIANLRAALRAGREGRAVVVKEASQGGMAAIPVLANLAYLDVAAGLELWRRWSLSALLERLLEREDDEVSAASIVAALVLQRCVAPGSKLYAQRWYPTTALPELLGIAPEQFNNSRIHRVMDALDAAGPQLQEQLPVLHNSRVGRFATLFLDVTDTHFEGRGCDLAERNRTKNGLRNRRKVGVVLLCDGNGNPLRWEVVPGKRSDHVCMESLVAQIQACPWIGEAPVVCDRAMGRPSTLDKLLRTEMNFLVAIPRHTIDGHGVELPVDALADVELTCRVDPNDAEVANRTDALRAFEADVERVRDLAERVGMTRVDDSLYVLELGTGTRPVADGEVPWVGPDDVDPTTLVGGASMLAWARIFARMLDAGVAKNRAALALMTGVSRARVTETMNLLRLDASVQDAIIRGDYGPISEHRLRAVVALEDAAAQRQQLETFATEQATHQTTHPMRARKLRITQTRPIRRVAYFNPAMFVAKRLRRRTRRRAFEAWVEELNGQLQSPYSRRDDDAIRLAVMEKLSAFKWLSLYTVRVLPSAREDGSAYWQVALELDTKEWDRRRRYDGFVVLAASASLPQSAAELAQLYRAKDMIERDFRLIKDVVELRPIYHHTDPKVRAHVTLCMLALLLQRSLEAQLAAAGIQMTAARCFEHLSHCHLNALERHALLTWMYSITRPQKEHGPLLQALGLKHLIDERAMAKTITPRARR